MNIHDEVGHGDHPATEHHHGGQHHSCPAQCLDSGGSQVVRWGEDLDSVGGPDLGTECGPAGLDQRFGCHGAWSPIVLSSELPVLIKLQR